MGIPLTTILKDIRESDFSFILDDYDEEVEEDEEEFPEFLPDGWEEDGWEREEEDNDLPETPAPETSKETPKKKIWH